MGSMPFLQYNEKSTSMQLHIKSFEQPVPGRRQIEKVILKQSSRKLQLRPAITEGT